MGNCSTSGRIHASKVSSPVVVTENAALLGTVRYCVDPLKSAARSLLGRLTIVGVVGWYVPSCPWPVTSGSGPLEWLTGQYATGASASTTWSYVCVPLLPAPADEETVAALEGARLELPTEALEEAARLELPVGALADTARPELPAAALLAPAADDEETRPSDDAMALELPMAMLVAAPPTLDAGALEPPCPLEEGAPCRLLPALAGAVLPPPACEEPLSRALDEETAMPPSAASSAGAVLQAHPPRASMTTPTAHPRCRTIPMDAARITPGLPGHRPMDALRSAPVVSQGP